MQVFVFSFFLHQNQFQLKGFRSHTIKSSITRGNRGIEDGEKGRGCSVIINRNPNPSKTKASSVINSSSAETVANCEDLLTKILLRVPARTLNRFKCVSKHWLSLISSPSFCNSHAKCVHNKSLYICTADQYSGNTRYHVHAIKVSDLFSFSRKPIIIRPSTSNPSKSKSKSKSCKSKAKSCVLREVASIGGHDDPSVARNMGFGVFGSQIVPVGGWITMNHPSRSYAFETSEPGARFVRSVIPKMELEAFHPTLLEIKGKLYALSEETFAVFDPKAKTKVWTLLDPLPFADMCHSYSVFGSKIFAIDMQYGTIGETFCFDVASPRGSWTRLDSLLEFEGVNYDYSKLLVLDSEDEFEKLMFTYDEKILVHRILLSHKGEPSKIELVASIDLPELPDFPAGCVPDWYCGAHLGDRKVCFSFSYMWGTKFKPVVVLTLEFAYSKSGDTSLPDISSSSNPSSLNCTSICGSFVAKALGSCVFLYKYPEEPYLNHHSLLHTRLGGLFVL